MDNALAFNGIDGSTGDYLLPSLSLNQVATVARGEPWDTQEMRELRAFLAAQAGRDRGPKEGVDPEKLDEAGWGVIFAENDGQSEAIRAHLAPLLEHRQEQAAKVCEHRYRELTYREGETKNQFLARHGCGPGPADPEKLPYYLLLVGDPEAIPFRFQYQLDVQYAVGRLSFETPREYAHYARSVVEAETAPRFVARRAVFFGVCNPDDTATGLSTEYLVSPLAAQLAKEAGDWQMETILAEGATKARLEGLLGGEQTPTLLFSACHGLGFPVGDPLHVRHQGALICQDWPGPRAWVGRIPEDHYLSADDIVDTARLSGLVAFHFACYGAGTPRFDEFIRPVRGEGRRELASRAFISSLPQRLLGHPRGGALAIIGHVERAWGYSFLWRDAGPQLTTFESVLKRLMAGAPVGWAMEFLNQRHAELTVDLRSELEELELGEDVEDKELARLWIAHRDARNYVVLGDPAVRVKSQRR